MSAGRRSLLLGDASKQNKRMYKILWLRDSVIAFGVQGGSGVVFAFMQLGGPACSCLLVDIIQEVVLASETMACPLWGLKYV